MEDEQEEADCESAHSEHQDDGYGDEEKGEEQGSAGKTITAADLNARLQSRLSTLLLAKKPRQSSEAAAEQDVLK